MSRLLARAIEGDPHAEKKIFECLLVRFKVLAKRRIRNEQDIEDIAQEACITVLKKYKTENFTTSFEAWAYGVLSMKVGNYLQSSKARQRPLPLELFSDRSTELSSPPHDYRLKRKLINCLKMILKAHSRYARVLNLVYQGYKTNEICQRMKIKPNYVHVILSRGRSMLRGCLEKGAV